jgi:electron-transferring-flavoprotein dehydrogenase
MELHGKYTVFAEGARGHLGKQLIAKYQLDAGKDPQTYGIGIKELWEIDPPATRPGMVLHTGGWPMDNDLWRRLPLPPGRQPGHAGLRGGPGLSNPYLSPFEEMQRWKTHPNIRYYLEGDEAKGIAAKRISTAPAPSRPAASEPAQVRVPRRRAGGLRRRLPQRAASRAATPRSRPACWRRSRLRRRAAGRQGDELSAYETAFENSWLYDELWKARNFKTWFKKGLSTAT